MSIRLKVVLRLILTLTFFLFILNLTRNLWRLMGGGERIEKAQRKLEKLVAENVRLRGEKERLESGDFVEGQARNKLFMARKNEIILILPTLTPQGKEEDLAKEELGENEEKEVWEKWLELFW